MGKKQNFLKCSDNFSYLLLVKLICFDCCSEIPDCKPVKQEVKNTDKLKKFMSFKITLISED